MRPKITFRSILVAFVCLFANAAVAKDQDINVQRLTWAGIKIVAADTTVFVDAVGADIWGGKAPDKLIPLEANTKRRYAVVTHTHNDHFDPESLKSVLGEKGYVICHQSIATYIASRGLRVIPVKTYEPVSRGGYIFTPVPAVDGFGDAQFSWIITGYGRRLLHGGDTLWHGNWPTIGRQYGPFDAAFLPVNGAVVPGSNNITSPAVMTPTQAADAAVLLNTSTVVPIHYGLTEDAGYREVEKPVEKLRSAIEGRGPELQELAVGEFIRWNDSAKD